MKCFKKNKSKDDVENALVSAAIEQQIKKERQADQAIKLLLLGTGSSGKSTFLKQLKTLHKEGFSDTEVDQFKESLPLNALHAMQKLIEALATHSEGEVTTAVKAKMDKILEASELSEECAAIVKDLWALDDIKEIFEKRADLVVHIEAAAPYYFENAVRFAKAEFKPSQDDMIRARTKTTGIRELHMSINDTEFTVVDVGGQRSERRKWIHCFDSVTAIIYLAALDEYDMRLEEDNRTNRLEESLQLFGEVSGSQFFLGKSISWVLFLNKVDLLEKKINQKPMIDYFSDFPPLKAGDLKASIKYFQEKYESKFKGDSKLYCHATCAIDTQNCEKIFAVVRESILRDSFHILPPV